MFGRTVGRVLALGTVAGVLSGCLLPAPLMVASYGASGAVWLETGKTPTDHAISAVRQEDCSLFRGLRREPICQAEEAMVTVADEPAGSQSRQPTAPPRPLVVTDRAEPTDSDRRVTVADLPPLSPVPTVTRPQSTDDRSGARTIAAVDHDLPDVNATPIIPSVAPAVPETLDASPAVAFAALAPVPPRPRTGSGALAASVADRFAPPLPPRRPATTAAGLWVPLPPLPPNGRAGQVQLAAHPGS